MSSLGDQDPNFSNAVPEALDTSMTLGNQSSMLFLTTNSVEIPVFPVKIFGF